MGFCVFSSAFSAALGDGAISAIVSFLRTLVFQILCVLALPAILPKDLKLDGIWLAGVLAELLSLIVPVLLPVAKRKKISLCIKTAVTFGHG